MASEIAIAPLAVSLHDVSTLVSETGRLELNVRPAEGAILALQGQIALNPLNLTGPIELGELQLAPFLPLAAPQSGTAALAVHYRIGNGGERLSVLFDQMQARIDQLRLSNGQLDLFDPIRLMNLDVSFRNIELTRLTPYTATFADRKIASGKLSRDLHDQLDQRRLQGDNRIVMERLNLGERIASPTARDLPLDLAIALLEDANGRIDLGLPVASSLGDLEFSSGVLIWKAIGNLLTKLVSAPFRALAALFGSGEAPETIVFAAGDARLTPPEREKLARLTQTLNHRPSSRALTRPVTAWHYKTSRCAAPCSSAWARRSANRMIPARYR